MGRALSDSKHKDDVVYALNTLSAALTNKSWNKTDKVVLQVYTFGLVSGYRSIYGKNVVDEMTKTQRKTSARPVLCHIIVTACCRTHMAPVEMARLNE
jgi:hypothetical protein